jgi:uncharacterized delta-60 repeat protein
VNRNRFRFGWERCEERTLLSTNVLNGVGTIGDSISVPYFGLNGTAHNWVEELVALRGINFGGPSSSSGNGGSPSYAYDWWGPNSYGALAAGAPSLAQQIRDGRVSLAAVELGTHDFVWYPEPQGPAPYEDSGNTSHWVAGDIFSGALSGPALQNYTNQVITNIGQVFNTLLAAGSVPLVAFNIPDVTVTPAWASLDAANPAGAQAYTAAVSAADAQYRALANQRGIPMIDLLGFSHLVRSGNPVVVGGVTLDLHDYSNPADPHNFFADSQHPGTVASGLIANMFIAAVDNAYGAGIAPLSDQEILQYAGITPPTSGSTYFDVSQLGFNRPPLVNISRMSPALLQGQVDTTFGNGGTVTTSLGSDDDEGIQAFALPNGKVLVAGITDLGTHDSNQVLALVRYNADGTLDSTYQNGPRASIPWVEFPATGPAVGPEGQLAFLSGSTLWQFNPDGSLDTAFGGGSVLTDLSSYFPYFPSHLAFDGDQIVLAEGFTVPSTSNGELVLERYNTDGSLDTGFGSGGRVITDLGLSNWSPFGLSLDQVSAVAVQPDGAILVGGEQEQPLSLGAVLARFTPSGVLDTSFGPDHSGREVVDTPYWFNYTEEYLRNAGLNSSYLVADNVVYENAFNNLGGAVVQIALAPDGGIVTRIGSYGSGFLTLFNSDGSLAPAIAAPWVPRSVVIQADGKAISLWGNVLTRYNLNGTLDRTFGPSGDGTANIAPDYPNTFPQGMPAESNGNTVVTGTVFDPTKNNGAGGWDIWMTRVIGQTPPAHSPEGTPITVYGTASTFTQASFSYVWSVTKNGSAFASASTDGVLGSSVAPFTFTPDEVGTYIVTLTVTDSSGATSSVTNTCLVDNVPPTSSVSGPSSAVVNQPLTFALGATDPSTVDQAAGFTYTVDWGDGTAQAPDVQTVPATAGNGAGLQALHTYFQTGSYIVQVWSTDKDGARSTQPATFTINVDYQFSGFLAPLSSHIAFALGRTMPIKFQLTDYNGQYITSLSAVTSLQVLNSQGTNVLTNSGSTALRYDPSANQFVANWQTKGLAAGSYTVTLILADGTVQTKTVTLSANGAAAGLLADGTTAAGQATAGALLGGDVAVYVDNSSGLFTTDELNRINDAVAAVDSVVGAYGVTVALTSDSTLADVVVDTASTSAVGGFADGVLGCEAAGAASTEITLIQGWNWYAGADPTGIAVGQFDFQTVVMHELGHALGLGHSAFPTSVMYATLGAGTANRNLIVADLHIPDADGATASGLHARVFQLAPQPAAAPPNLNQNVAVLAWDAALSDLFPTGVIRTQRKRS